jgi:succinate dehydrogenase / fumarate reductase cytochrome b subunit
MRWSALFLLAFVVYHLLDLTFGTVHPSFEEGDVYHNVIASFRLLPVSLVYIAAMLLLWPHLRHGVWSMLRTLGLGHPRYQRLTQRGGGVRRRRGRGERLVSARPAEGEALPNV